MAQETPAHFKGKDALGHVVEAQARGMIAATEVHGLEAPGNISAGADSCRETAIILALVWVVCHKMGYPHGLFPLLVISLGWLIWKAGRCAWLAWSRLERLHRVLEQERWEIEHHRQQERDELRELYRAKGFEGKLLEDVLDVLMADNNRLLKVMVEEELGLTLASVQHPLKQSLGAAIGVIIGAAICLGCALILPYGVLIGTVLSLILSAALSAKQINNEVIPAIVWNLGIGILAIGTTYFLMNYMTSK